MYFIFGDTALDSLELGEKIQRDTALRVESDLTKSTKREDVGAFLLRLKEEDIDCECKDIESMDQKIDILMKKADEYAGEVSKILPRYSIFRFFAFRYDEVEREIEIVFLVAHRELGEKKLVDILNRILKQI